MAFARRWAGRSAHKWSAIGIGAALLGGLSACGSGPSDAVVVTSEAGTAAAACELVPPAAVERVLGVSPNFVAGPDRSAAGGCSWHSIDPSCTMRMLGLEVQTGPDAEAAFAAAKDAIVVRHDLEGLGRQAHFSLDPLPADAYIQIGRLDMLTGSSWVRLTVSGRLGDGGRELLQPLAATMAVSLP